MYHCGISHNQHYIKTEKQLHANIIHYSSHDNHHNCYRNYY